MVSKVGDITQDQQVRGKINDIIRKMVNHLGGRAEVGEPRWESRGGRAEGDLSEQEAEVFHGIFASLVKVLANIPAED